MAEPDENISVAEHISLWEPSRAFFQANTTKGARYIDDAGLIINDYSEDYWDIFVGVDGLHIVRPKVENLPDQIIVDMRRIWMVCYGSDCLERIVENSPAIAKNISRHIGVNEYKRLGLRVHYFRPTSDVKKYMQGLYATITTPDLQLVAGKPDHLLQMTFSGRFIDKPFFMSLGFAPVIVERPAQGPADYDDSGMIIDIDVWQDKESVGKNLGTAGLGAFIREASKKVVDKAKETVMLLRRLETNE